MADENERPPAGGFGGRSDPYAAPKMEDDIRAQQAAIAAQHVERGGCLSVFLVLMMIANPIIGLLYLLNGEMFRRALPHAPDWALPVMGILALVNFGCAVGIWMWKKWGVFGTFGVAALGFVMNLMIGVNPFNAIMGLGGPIILYFLVKERWARFT